MDKDSIRVRGTGPGKILNINILKKFAEVDNREKVKELQEKIDSLQDELNSWKDTLAATKNQQEKSTTAQQSFASEFPKWFSLGKIQLTAIKELKAHFETEIIGLAEKIRELTKKIKLQEKKIQVLTNKLYQVKSSGTQESDSFYELEIILAGEMKADFDLEIDYMVHGAYWIPLYDILIFEEKVEIYLKANLYNETEVDWKEVTLDISTANIRPVKMEKPTPYNIDHTHSITRYGSGKKRKGGRMGRKNAPMKQMVYSKMDSFAQTNVMEEMIAQESFEPDPSPKIESNEADVSDNLGVQVYNLKTMFTIESSQEPKPIQLLREELPAIKQYYWTCITPGRVLVNNKIKNRDHLILPGDAKIYVKGEFIGSTELDLIAPHQEFKIGERVTYDVKVKKEMKAKKKVKEGAFKGKNATTYEYNIEIENLNKASEELIMYERIPHSISEKIKVKLLDISEDPATNVINVMKFVLKMDKIPSKKVIKYSYQVISEKDIYINPPLP
jgi:uncharacterized protein (TIGR02231 family)